MAYGDSVIWAGNVNLHPSGDKGEHKIRWTTTFTSRLDDQIEESCTVTFTVKSDEDVFDIARNLAKEWDRTHPQAHRARAYANMVRFNGNVTGMAFAVGDASEVKIEAYGEKNLGIGLTVRNSF